jgi:hypothetical protein
MSLRAKGCQTTISTTETIETRPFAPSLGRLATGGGEGCRLIEGSTIVSKEFRFPARGRRRENKRVRLEVRTLYRSEEEGECMNRTRKKIAGKTRSVDSAESRRRGESRLMKGQVAVDKGVRDLARSGIQLQFYRES